MVLSWFGLLWIKDNSVRYYRNLTARVSARPEVRFGEDCAKSDGGTARSDPPTARCCWWERVRREDRSERSTVELAQLHSGITAM